MLWWQTSLKLSGQQNASWLLLTKAAEHLGSSLIVTQRSCFFDLWICSLNMRPLSLAGQEKPRDIRIGQKILLLQAGNGTYHFGSHFIGKNLAIRLHLTALGLRSLCCNVPKKKEYTTELEEHKVLSLLSWELEGVGETKSDEKYGESKDFSRQRGLLVWKLGG